MYSGEESTVLPGEFEDARTGRRHYGWRRLRMLDQWLWRLTGIHLWGLGALILFVLSAGAPTGYGG